jgi:arginyl-tRNA synthetase
MNPFKQAHVGHLYTTIVGDVISRLYEASGATVHRVNFGGDVGLHVARCMWGITQFLGGEKPEGLQAVGDDPHKRMAWLSDRYVEGNRAYESDEDNKQKIIDINRRVYDVHAQNDHESAFATIYWTCREWSYEYFKQFYDELQVVQFEKYYPESQTAPEGTKLVREQLEKGVYELSDGAVVFDGEKYGLHTRVFINSHGLPTYEAKDVGVSIQKWRDYNFDRSIIITGSDIIEYMKVVIKSIEQFAPEPAQRTLHIPHGNVKLTGGVKMSSRLGNGLSPEDVLESARSANREATGKDDESAVLGAVKYAFLRSRIGSDIIYDPAESVSIHGNSGPYLQYAHARARSILAKASNVATNDDSVFEAGERTLARKISEYPEAVQKAIEEHMPHHICTYLYDLAQTFNRFYENNRVVGDPREAIRLELVRQYADVLKDGLGLLGIVAPDHM